MTVHSAVSFPFALLLAVGALCTAAILLLFRRDLAAARGATRRKPHAEAAETKTHAETAESAEPKPHAESAEFAEKGSSN